MFQNSSIGITFLRQRKIPVSLAVCPLKITGNKRTQKESTSCFRFCCFAVKLSGGVIRGQGLTLFFSPWQMMPFFKLTPNRNVDLRPSPGAGNIEIIKAERWESLLGCRSNFFIPRNLQFWTHGLRTPKKPEYLIALATSFFGVRWDSVPFNFWWIHRCFFWM